MAISTRPYRTSTRKYERTCTIFEPCSFRFPYHCAGVQHNQCIIYISHRARSQTNIKKKINWKFRFKGIILLTGTRVQHNKLICCIQTLVCMVRVTGHDNNSVNIHNHLPIILYHFKLSVHHDKTMCRICPRLRSQATLLLKTCCRSIICKASYQLLSPDEVGGI